MPNCHGQLYWQCAPQFSIPCPCPLLTNQLTDWPHTCTPHPLDFCLWAPPNLTQPLQTRRVQKLHGAPSQAAAPTSYHPMLSPASSSCRPLITCRSSGLLTRCWLISNRPMRMGSWIHMGLTWWVEHLSLTFLSWLLVVVAWKSFRQSCIFQQIPKQWW